MKYTAMVLIIFLAGCSTRGSQNLEKQAIALPSPIKKKPLKQESKSNNNASSTELILSKHESPSKQKSSTSSSKPSTPAVKKKVKYKNQYTCEIDTIYKVHSAQSMTTDKGKLELKVNKASVTLAISDTKMDGIYELPLKSRSGFSIIAVNKSMVFAYNINAQTFHFNTGIGAFKFNLSGGGHQGKQMRLSGTCS